jgi:hypothetical protein
VLLAQVKRLRVTALVLLPALAATGALAQSAAPVPDSIWGGRLWLTSQALGLSEDCTVGVLFRDPKFRSTPLAGGSVTSRLVSPRMSGGDLLLTVDTLRGGQRAARVRSQLRGHPSEGVVSVESIDLAGGATGGHRTPR